MRKRVQMLEGGGVFLYFSWKMLNIENYCVKLLFS